MRAYQRQDRQQSAALMALLEQQDGNCRLYKLYAQRIAATRDQPIDPDWDGATNFESK